MLTFWLLASFSVLLAIRQSHLLAEDLWRRHLGPTFDKWRKISLARSTALGADLLPPCIWNNDNRYETVSQGILV